MVKMECIEGERMSKVKMEIRNVRKQSVYGLVLSKLAMESQTEYN
jgi:hypothetical protein